jgi:hypothetical protein
MISREPGRERYEGFCPFHREKTPSFQVYVGTDGQGHWHCKGCHKEGSAAWWIYHVERKAARDAFGGRRSREKQKEREATALKERRQRWALRRFHDQYPDTSIPEWAIEERKPMRVIVCGGRDYWDKQAIFEALDRLHQTRGIDCVIHGAAKGADYLASQWAAARGVPCETYPADWDDINHPDAVIRSRKNGKPYNAKAGPIRNQKMIDTGKPDGVVAFPGDKGTADMIRRAGAATPELKVWRPVR